MRRRSRSQPAGPASWQSNLSRPRVLKEFPSFVKMMAAIGVTRLELCSPDRLDTGEFRVLANELTQQSLAYLKTLTV